MITLHRAGLLALAVVSSLYAQPPTAKRPTSRPVDAIDRLAGQRILADRDLDDVDGRARALLKTGLNAGSGYPEIWIRDWATFMALSCEVNDPAVLREGLLRIMKFQRADGNIPDGVVPMSKPPKELENFAGDRATAPLITTIHPGREVIVSPRVTDFVGFKNSVETDQETSLVLAVKIYIDKTGDRSILEAEVEGKTVLERLRLTLTFLQRDRWSAAHGLIWGGTTIDWGDIAPEDDIGAVISDKSHRAIDIYDNALLVLAARDMATLTSGEEAAAFTKLAADLTTNVRKHLWDVDRQKFRPHLYLNGSPFPASFNENAIWYHGGTIVAIQAGILTDDETRASLKAIRLNVAQARGRTAGVTNYPVYPKGLFKNRHVDPGVYQNGGDWDWFGARLVSALVARGMGAEAYTELLPMVQRVTRHDGFFEWFDADDKPQGSKTFRGSAGVLWQAIADVREWAKETAGPQEQAPTK